MFLVVPSASAENWTIQVFAYTQEERAELVAGQLRKVGYDAYTDAAPGASLVQVRIGCFSAQPDADALAQDVQQRVALDAIVVPLLASADPTVCTDHELGFIPPPEWGLESSTEDNVTFWLETGGRRTITFDGDRWTLAQTGPDGSSDRTSALGWFGTPLVDPPAALSRGLSARFRPTQSRGLPLVRADLGGGSLLVTAGELLWSSARAAVVRRGADVFALRLYRP